MATMASKGLSAVMLGFVYFRQINGYADDYEVYDHFKVL